VSLQSLWSISDIAQGVHWSLGSDTGFCFSGGVGGNAGTRYAREYQVDIVRCSA